MTRLTSRSLSLLPLISALLVTVPRASAQPWNLTGNTPAATQFLGTTNIAPLRLFTSGAYRGLIHQNGYVGFGTAPSPLSGFQGPVTLPQSQLHLGEQCANVPGFGGAAGRPWMKIGTFMCFDTDSMYVGLKDEGVNRKDAVIAWGDDFGNIPAIGPDALRVIFSGILGSPGSLGGGPHGSEVARFLPNGNVGIGDFYTLAPPANRLDIKGNAVIGTAFAASAGPLNGLAVEGPTGIGTLTPALALFDVNGTARIRNLTGSGTSLVTADSKGVLHSLVFPTNPNLVLLGNGSFGPAPSGPPDNDWTVNGSGMFATNAAGYVTIGQGSVAGLGKLTVISKGSEPATLAVSATGSQSRGGDFDCNGAPASEVGCVYGLAHANAAINIGVWGDAEGVNQNFGVEADATNKQASQNIGVRAIADAGPNTILSVGVFAKAPVNKTKGYAAGYFQGDVTVTGTITGGAKNFKIDHPLDPENRYLNHSVVEGPDMMNIYNGYVTTDGHGEAWVDLPSYFEALNRDSRYQLTVVGQFAQAIVAQKVQGNRFLIRTDKASIEVSWQVIGIRNDPYARANPLQVEQEKSQAERGLYLHPELYKAAPEKSLSTLIVK